VQPVRLFMTPQLPVAVRRLAISPGLATSTLPISPPNTLAALARLQFCHCPSPTKRAGRLSTASTCCMPMGWCCSVALMVTFSATRALTR
jgi:hypothetical protein